VIGERFEIPVEDLKAQNKLASNEIEVGQKLVSIKFIAAAALAVAIVLLTSDLSLVEANEEKEKPQLMLVQTAKELFGIEKKINLVAGGRVPIHES
jgi:LysM repeat protein